MDNIKLSRNGHESVIAVQGNFVFDLNRVFRNAYQTVRTKTPFIVDLSQTG